MARPADRAPTPRGQRLLAAMAFAVIAVSALAVVALLVLHAIGLPTETFRTPGMVVLQVVPLPGLTIGLLLVLALVVVNLVGRSRASRR